MSRYSDVVPFVRPPGGAIRMMTARMKYRTEEDRAAAARERQIEKLRRERAQRHARGLKKHRVETEDRPPAKVLAARDALPPPRSPTAALFGDPRPGRSALDQRGGCAS